MEAAEGMVVDSEGMAADSGGTAAVLEVVAGVSGGGSTVEVFMAGDISSDPIMADPIMITLYTTATVPRMDSTSASADMVGVDTVEIGTVEIGTVGAGDNYA
jgi:hypothetical protein